MPTTTNNGWTTPADTDLVKNGALAIRTLGNAIDTTLGVYSAPGSTLINSSTFSGVSSVSKDNVFSSSYLYYLLVATFNGTAGAYLQFKFRASGTDNSSGYNYVMNLVSTGGSAFNFVGAGASQAYISRIANSATTQNNVEIMIYNPFATKRKSLSGTTFYDDGATVAGGAVGANNSSTSSHDGFSLIPSSGNITGDLKLYGLKN